MITDVSLIFNFQSFLLIFVVVTEEGGINWEIEVVSDLDIFAIFVCLTWFPL